MVRTETEPEPISAPMSSNGAFRADGLLTPALLVDLDAMDRNMQRMAGYFQARSARLRPHFKGHQVLSLASRQVEAGAIGIACARIEQAEKLVGAGVRNVLIANEIAGESAIRRFIELSSQAPVVVAVDSAPVVADMARLAGNHRSALNVVVDVDLGLHRCGVAPEAAALALARAVLEKGLKLRGLMGYRGNLKLPPGIEKEQQVTSALHALVASRRLLQRDGIPVETVSSGGTTDYSIVGDYPGITEVQAGSYLLMDQWKTQFVADFTPTLSILTTVLHRDDSGRLITDGGVKAMSAFRGLPKVKSILGLALKALHAEHCLMEITDPSIRIEAGDQVEIWVEYIDATISRHRQMYGYRNGKLEEIFEIEH
jgi:D-serine deaminase-like pyridoxal phosphate-dependent protein